MMPQCIKCKCCLPPHFVDYTEDGKERECIFCQRGTNEIRYGDNKEKVATKQEIIKEYDVFLKMVKEKNEILLKKKGNIPSKIILQ